MTLFYSKRTNDTHARHSDNSTMKTLASSCVNSTNNGDSFNGFSSNLEVFIFTILASFVCLKMESKLTHMIKGVATVFVMTKLAEVTNFNMLILLMEKVINCGPLVGVVIFQPEIRSALQYLGRRIHFKKRRSVNARVLFAIEETLHYNVKRKIGALITIERLMSLDDFISTGTPLDADVTGELLTNIFIPNTPLHDGAVIIRRAKIAVASAYLPLSARTLSSKYGTRHRAALGISEVSDSITLVVSEETGDISVAYDSRLTNNLTVEKCLLLVKRVMSLM